MILTLLLASVAAVPQTPPDDLKKDVDAFKDLIADRNSGEAAIPFIDKFVARYKSDAESVHDINDKLELKEGSAEDLKKQKSELEKEQKMLASTVWQSFANPARKQVTDTNLQLWKSAAFAFGQMGEQGSGYLLDAFKQDRFDKQPDFRATLIEQVGYTKDYSKDKDLVDLLDFHQDVVIAAAAKALGQFREAPGERRKFMVENLVKKLESYSNQASDVQDTVSIQKYTTVRGPMVDALKKLTGEAYNEPLEWTKWWNNNKNKPELWKDSK